MPSSNVTLEDAIGVESGTAAVSSSTPRTIILYAVISGSLLGGLEHHHHHPHGDDDGHGHEHAHGAVNNEVHDHTDHGHVGQHMMMEGNMTEPMKV